MSNVINLKNQDYNFESTDIILFDTNIWIYLFYPLGDFKQKVSAKYSEIYKKILMKKCKIIVPTLVISEFFNVCLKFEFSRYQDLDIQKYKSFKKDFRGTEEYKIVVQKLIETIKNSILKNSTLVNDNLETLKLDNILTTDEEFDFNDKVLIEICKKYNAKILTHDKDFMKYFTDFDLDVLIFC